MSRRRFFLPCLAVFLLSGAMLSGCGVPKWAIEKWGEDQYMSYRIGPRNLALFTYPRRCYPFEAEPIRSAVKDVHEAAAADGRAKNLVVFVHGRGKHPEKAYGDDETVGRDILSRLETAYEAKVLMVHWPSWLTPWGYPSKNAEEAGAHLGPLFDELARYRSAQRADSVKTTLLVHSMGAQVLKRFLKGYDGRFAKDPPMFDAVVLNAPDVSLAGHRLWLDRIDFAGTVYVTVNEKDGLLQFSRYLLGEPRLGRGLAREDGSLEPLSDRAVYLDVSAAGVDHDYFIGAERPENLVSFYRNVIGRTETAALEGPGIRSTARGRVYAIVP